MRGTDDSTSRQQPSAEAKPTRNTLLFASVLLAVGLVGALLTLNSHQPAPTPAPPSAQPAPVVEVRTSSVPKLMVTQPPEALTSAVPAAPTGPRPPRDLMAELIELSSVTGPLTPEQAEKFKRNLAALIEQGPASVPAIREFLEKNIEFHYLEMNGGDQLGYPSFRASLFDTLRQIGGPEAQATMLKALQTTALPVEILELAKNLDTEAPGAYRDQILNAAQEALAMDAAGQLGTNREVGPAFHALDTYGQPATIEEVAKTDPVNFYNALNLASLPEGQGLTGLMQMAQNSTGSAQAIAVQMIAQLAGQNSQALETLLQMAQKGQLSNAAWMRLAPMLGGDQYQIDTSGAGGAAGGDALNYTVVHGGTSPEEINQRLATLDRCLGVVPPDSAAAIALKQQRDRLVAQLGH